MADTTISPNMNLPVPVPSTAPGPDWANDIVADMYAIDSHDHTNGKGVPITPDGLNITADLPMNENNLTEVRSVNFEAQSAPLSLPADIGCLYVSGADLYYNDEAGNQVRITQSGSVTGSTGTITGLPSGTASASYSAGTFTFQSATSTPANMAVGPLIIGRNAASSKTVTLTPNAAQAANYGIGFPAALPAATNYTTLDASGNLSFNSSGTTGSGAVVLATSPTLVTPAISGTPTGNVTGSGAVVLATSPTITTPAISGSPTGNVTGSGAVVLGTSPTVAAPTLTGTVTSSGVINAATGSAGAPAYSFTGDPDTGFYSTASGAAAFSANGSASVVLNTVGASFLDGTAAAPAINFNADTDNGFYRAATNTIGIAAGGVVAATVEADALHLSGYLETASGGIFKVKVFTGTLGATSTTTLSVSGTVVGAFGWTTRAANVNFSPMADYQSGTVPSGVYFDGNTAASVTSSQIKINNGEASSRNYSVVAFYQ